MLRSLASALIVLLLAVTASAGDHSTTHLPAGIDHGYFDKTADPRNDFYRYACGTWLDTVEIPADKSMYSSFSELSDLNEARIKTIVEEAAKTQATTGTAAQQIGDFYKAYMDTARLEQLGAKPLAAEFARIDALSELDQIPALMAHLNKLGVKTPVSIGVSVDAKNAQRYTVYMSQSGLSLPDRDYYLDKGEKMTAFRAEFVKHITQMMEMLGRKNPAVDAQTVLDIETRFAEAFWTRVASRDRDKTYNKFSQEELASQSPGFPWQRLFAELFPASQALVVSQPSYMQSFAQIFPTVTLEQWRAYFTWRVLTNYAELLSANFQDADFAFFDKILVGTEEQEARWKRAVSAENDILGELVGKLFVEKHFKPEAKQRMEELVANLKATFAERLEQLPWMSDTTKKEAHTKLSMFRAKIGYPNKWRDFSDLRITADDLVGNVMRANLAESARDYGRLDQPVDRDEWAMTPQTVNAYYSSTRNEIVFPAAILQPPFFDMSVDMAANYGAIGAVIGHEITHGFDDQGRKSDGHGNLRDWWTAADRAEFDKRANLMVEQYNAFKPLPDASVNGNLTLGENIADLGGLTMAYYAYKRSLNNQPSPVIDGYTGEQRLFLSWAQSWRRKYREEALRERLATDSHSPGFCRAIGPVSNMPEFYEAFKVKEGDKMFRNPEIRVRIW